MTKYTASNQNLAPARPLRKDWASVVEIMVSVGLLASLVSYLLFPAMIGGHVFRMIASAVADSAVGAEQVVLVLPSGDVKGLLWLCAFSTQLASVAVMLAVVLWALPVRSFPNVSLLAKAFVLALISSGDFVRSSSIKLPEGATLPVLPMSGLVDLPAVATQSMLSGFAHNGLAPFLAVALAGIVVGLYRMGAARLSRKIAAVKTLEKSR